MGGWPVFEVFSSYPAVHEDLAVVVGESVPAVEVAAVVRKAGGSLLVDVQLFDLYLGEQIQAGKKSLAFRITYRSAERSLTDLEVNDIHSTFSQKVINAFQAELR
jgi:phenylalanyl-tRNA synthetase beta chain